jgi:hypothetical protein
VKLGSTRGSAYRCSLLDSAENVHSVEHLDSRDDTEAIIQAIALLGEQTRYMFAEVWCGARIVARLPKADAELSPQTDGCKSEGQTSPDRQKG